MFFLSFGDWGENSHIKTMISTLILRLNPDAILSLGDNFYDYGVSSIDDPLWESQFNSYFFVKFYAILGNHDYLGNTLAQIQYSTINSNWIMPNRYYDRMYEDVHLIAIDTYEMAYIESMSNAVSMGQNASDCFRQLDALTRDKQLQWLENSLKSSKSKWKIVFGHYPIYSNGVHGNTTELTKTLLPLLKKYNVHLYLAGHDHNICYREDKVHCLVSGTGSRVSRIHSNTEFVHLSSSIGVAYIKTSMETLEFGFYDLEGNTILQKII
jgi:tartrate-resistant acid phosphatase type 5